MSDISASKHYKMNFVPKPVLKPSALLKHMETAGCSRVWGRKWQIIIHNMTFFLKTCFGYKYKQQKSIGEGIRPRIADGVFPGYGKLQRTFCLMISYNN